MIWVLGIGAAVIGYLVMRPGEKRFLLVNTTRPFAGATMAPGRTVSFVPTSSPIYNEIMTVLGTRPLLIMFGRMHDGIYATFLFRYSDQILRAVRPENAEAFVIEDRESLLRRAASDVPPDVLEQIRRVTS